MNASRHFLLTTILILLSEAVTAQKRILSLDKALVEISVQSNHAILFDPAILPEKDIVFPLKSADLHSNLKELLDGTDIDFLVENGQIFLTKREFYHGFIEDASTGEKLILAVVRIDEKEEYVVANEDAYFSFYSSADSFEIVVNYLGYQACRKMLSREDPGEVIVLKLHSQNKFNEILITDQVSSDIDRQYIEQDKGNDILLRKNQSISAIGGEPDIHQALMRQAGVTTGADGIGGIHLRGGKQDQNLVLYDGVKMYNSSHALGVFSIFNSSIVDQAKMHKRGSAGKYSGRLSSVLDVRVKDPNLHKISGSLQVSSLASQANIELPIVKNRLSILASYRRSHIDPLIDAISKNYYGPIDEASSQYYFQDLNLKALYKLGRNQKLVIRHYSGKDKYFLDVLSPDVEFDDGVFDISNYSLVSWRNSLTALRLNSMLSSSTFANFSISSYSYRFLYNQFDQYEIDSQQPEQYQEDFNSQIRNYTARVDLETVLSFHHLKYGLVAEYRAHNPGDLEYEYTGIDTDTTELVSFDFPDYYSYEINTYLSDKIKFSDRVLLEAAAYFTSHSTEDPYNETVQHNRLHGYAKLHFKLAKGLFVGSSIGRYVQFEHLVSTSDAGFPNDVWFPSTGGIKPEESIQWDVFANFKRASHRIELAVFQKNQSGILFYASDNSLPSLFSRDNEYWDEEVDLGTAEAYGIEIDYSLELGEKFLLHSSYTYNKTDYEFPQVNDGKAFPFAYSIPHTFVIGSNINLYKKCFLAIDWFSHSGRPITDYSFDALFSPLTLFDSDATRIGSINGNRLSPSYKLSLSVSNQWEGAIFTHNLSLGIQNITNRRNVIYQYDTIDFDNQSYREYQYGFPIAPMLRYRLSF